MGKGSDVPEYSEDQPDSEVYYHCTYYYPTPPKIDLKKKGYMLQEIEQAI